VQFVHKFLSTASDLNTG